MFEKRKILEKLREFIPNNVEFIRDDKIMLINGFYDNEGSHIWGTDSVFILVKGALFMTLRIQYNLGKEDAVIKAFNCSNHKELTYNMTSNGSCQEMEIDITSNNFLLNVCIDKYVVPVFEGNSSDYRKLGICISNMECVKGSFYKVMLEKVKVDENQSLFNIKNYDYRNVHDSDYYFFSNFDETEIGGGVFLDIGANIGQSACSVATVNPYIAIQSYEPNKMLEGNLEWVKRVLGKQMNYFMYGIGEENSEKIFYVPRVGSQYFTQEGTFIKEELEIPLSQNRIKEALGKQNINIEYDEFSFEIKHLLDSRIESYFIKIDTQGFELSTIKGIKSIIEKCRPIILLEKNENLGDILSFLKNYLVYYYDYKTNRLRKSDTATSNVFMISSDLTVSNIINEKLIKIMD